MQSATTTKEAVMADKKMKREVEGHTMRVKMNDAEAPAETDIISDEARDSDNPEVEGHAKRFFKDPAEQPAAQVQGHSLRVKASDDPEAPAETELKGDEARESATPEVEGHPFKHG
jgi:hypothetical protein